MGDVTQNGGPIPTVRAPLEAERNMSSEGGRKNSRIDTAVAVDFPHDAIINENLDGVITGWNESAERIFGYRAAEVIGKSIWITVPPERVDEEKEILSRVRSGGWVDRYETEGERKDGTRLRLSVKISPVKDCDGRIIGASEICREVAGRAGADESRFRDAVRQIADYAIFSMEPGGAINTWNEGCRRVLGYEESEFLEMNSEQLFVPEDIEAGIPESELKKAAKKGSAYDNRWMMRKNGERFWASSSATALRDKNGVLFGFTKVMRDLTCERQIEQETGQNVERFRFLAETTRNLLETRDPAELMNRIYEGLAAIFGLEFYFHYLVEPHARKMRLCACRCVPQEAVKEIEMLEFGQTVCGTAARDVRAIIISDVQQSKEPMTEFIRKLGITAYACHPLIANGELLGTLSFGTTRVRSFAPEIVAVMRALSDIVALAIARKRVEERLAERARLLDISRDAIIVRDLDQRVVFWNHGAEALFGWTEAEAMGKNPCVLLHSVLPVPLEMLTEQFNRDDYWEGEIVQTTKDGREVVVLATGSMARDEKGQPRGILHTYTDITELKRVQRELAKANEELSDYARNLEVAVQERTAHLKETIAELEGVSYSLSHDMRAPLRTINSFAQIILAEAGEKLGPLEKDLLHKSISAAERLDRLIQDILIYTRVARGPASLENVDVEQLLRQIIAERPELQPPKAEISIQSPLGSVCGHQAHLTQCITNLLGNAVKFVTPGTLPRIHIRSEVHDGKTRLWFEDNGIGVPREAQERIFGIFERMHDEKLYPGTGIGLSIVRKAAERMGGSVGLESEPGKGCRFWLQLAGGEKSSNVSCNERPGSAVASIASMDHQMRTVNPTAN